MQLMNASLKEHAIAENEENLKYFDARDLFFVPRFKKDVDIRFNETLILEYSDSVATSHELWNEKIVNLLRQ